MPTRADILDKFRFRIAQGSRTKLRKEELETLIETFLEALAVTHAPEEIQDLCQAEIALLEEGYAKITLASGYIPRYRAAIEAAIAQNRILLTPENSHTYLHQQRVTGIQETRDEHWALTYFKYSPEEYEQLDRRQAQVNRKRLLNLKTVPLDRYLNKITHLLHSQDNFAARHLAIAIAALTGRRMGEVVARGTFMLTAHPYLLHFTGQQKHERDGYNIVTLIPAEDLLAGIKRFRSMPDIKALMKLEGGSLKAELNKFDVQLNRECNKLLNRTEIVPPLEGKSTVTIHNLRSLWGAIATYFFCPIQHHEYAFLQHYLGHVLESSATGHYFRYQLTDAKGDLLRDKGIKLSAVPELPLLDEEMEQMEEEQLSLEPTAIEETSDRLGHEIEQAILHRFEALQREWLDYRETMESRLQDLEWAKSGQLDAAQQRRLQDLQKDNQGLRDENERLRQALAEAEGKLAQFRQLLLGEAPEPENRKNGKEAEAATTALESDSSSDQRVRSKPVPKRKAGRKPGQAVQRATEIFHQVQEWNREHPDQTFVINPGFLETVFKINRKAAKQFCEEHQAELWEHHQEIGVEVEVSHNRGKDVEALRKYVGKG
ncbi:protelomerase family protein [Lyngbya confervoides]|uniref:Telomere resolvase n=1 Tax=Lyngbya confervoides BDU141951 TaxID=1574623 RepID=A0ABD4SY54_9CYAN|nr:protelomerase family protein [Lyngbya confervoides]MCM1981437.1 telomere resolvase [Lyngbya confervoides BDU141951]